MELRAIIVEDEAPARETLELYLTKYCPSVKVVATAADANTAFEKIRNTPVDLVFLDVEMPYGNAFDLLERLGEIRFETIFITAYEHYALEALNKDAVHYILKPLEIEELIKAVDKVEQLVRAKSNDLQSDSVMNAKDYRSLQAKKFIFPHMKGFDLIEINRIVLCMADNNYTEFVFTDGTRRLISKTLKHIEGQLGAYGFLRVHKKYMVNLQHIASYQKGKTGSLHMIEGSEVPITTAGKTLLMELLD